MTKHNSNRYAQNALIVLAGTVVAVVAVACLYWAQIVFIPLAMAIFLAFLLSPGVAYLQRRIGRIPAVLTAMLLAALLLGGLIWLVTAQLTSLAERLPRYSENIQAKVKTVSDRLDQINKQVGRVLGTPDDAADPDGQPPVVVKPDAPPWVASLSGMLQPAAHALGGFALAVVLTGFMLLEREELRNRLIRLAGNGHLTSATRALDDTARRVSRFLQMQALVCAGTGAVIGVGLYALGVEYALLWGFFVFALRYIPYLGIWVAALPPVLLSFASSQGWAQPLAVVGLIFVVEMIAGNVLEPWLYGKSMGVSQVSLLVAAAFWALLWGPIGMVLSSPLTVCLVVLGKHYPRLKFLDVLLGDEPALEPDVRFYQRLLARDQDEAAEIASARMDEAPGQQVIDEVLVPALTQARRDRERDELGEQDELAILEATREIGEELASRLGVPDRIIPGPISGISEDDLPPRARVACVAADDDEDEVAMHLLAATLDPNRWEAEVLPAELRGSELIAHLSESQPELVCVAALPPGGLAHTRYLCKRLRTALPAAKILVARWGAEEVSEQSAEQLRQAGTDHVTASLVETLGWMNAEAEEAEETVQAAGRA